MSDLARWALRHADDCLVLAQRLGALVSRGPDLEEDIATANVALDLLGRARALYTRAGELEGADRGEDDFAMGRDEREFTNLLLVEQPDPDFAHTVVRRFLFDAWQVPFLEALAGSNDEPLAGIAERGAREARYHLGHSSAWVVRLGDGTPESHARATAALDHLWRFTGELFDGDDLDRAVAEAGSGVDPATLRPAWTATVDGVLADAGLVRPDEPGSRSGGRHGIHTEALGPLLAEMQHLHRSHPGATW